MRTVAHVSDLHFGATDPVIVTALLECLATLRPDVVAVSGDLTQRARRHQFIAARAFLDAVPFPQVVVPGNHDVPLYNVLARFARPLYRYRRHITAERYPSFIDDEIAVVGADTTRSMTIAEGGLRTRDVRRLSEQLDQVPADVVRILVCHHPFDPLLGHRRRLTMPAPDAEAVNTLVTRGVDIFLTGHRHLSYAGHTAMRYQIQGRAAIVVEAGTATSVRVRGEVNTFNVLRVSGAGVSAERWEWQPEGRAFVPAQTEAFVRAESGWVLREMAGRR